MSTWQAITMSVISSFIVLFIIGVIKWQWEWWIINVWLKISCRHIVDISGKWKLTTISSNNEDYKWNEEIILKQYGWKVKGDIAHKNIVNNSSTLQGDFKFEGIFREGILSCYFWNSDRSKKGIGSFVLNLEGDGNKFAGQHCYYDTEISKIKCIRYEWERC